MTGGILQLVAYGVQDIFITKNPQITFFKVVYRRHTNFSIEVIPQYFTHTPNFGKKATCILSRNGDLINKIYIVITLPSIIKFLNNDGNEDTITKLAWVKKIGFAIIKMVEIEIGGQTVDKQYGEWMHIWHELSGPIYENFYKMIGSSLEANNYTNGKDEIKLYVPLQFWFCKVSGMSLPVLNLQYNEVKINIELETLDKCLNITPTNYIEIHQDIVNFIKDEYIEQHIDDDVAFGIFKYFDVTSKKLYYHRISRIKFKSITNTTITNEAELNTVLNNVNNQKYLINGLTSKFSVMPKINIQELVHSYNKIRNINLKDCFLLVDYIFLDDEERVKFSQAKHEYLIEQINIMTEKTLDSTNRTLKLEMKHPCKLLVWMAQQSYLKDTRNNDHFNYTDDYKLINNKYVGKNLVDMSTILLNGQERLNFRDATYFNWIQPYQHFTYAPSEGINIYSFCMFPEKHQPSGSSNMSKIDNILLRIRLKTIINFSNDAKLKSYFMSYNILRIMNGLSALVFTN